MLGKFRKSCFLNAVALALLAIAGCTSVPDYSNTPSITFKKISFRPRTNGGFTDTIFITLDYTDGDGNLGLSKSDTNPPYSTYIGGQCNINQFNIIVSPEVKARNGVNWEPLKFADAQGTCQNSYNGRFPLLNDKLSNPKPLKGTMEYNIPSVAFPVDSLMRFYVYIQDRKLNHSNTILTDSVYITP